MVGHLKKIESDLQEKGYKLTSQRRLILEVFDACPGHYTAQEIHEKAKLRHPSINFSTIYRNLELLSRLDIINKLNISPGISHYELKGYGHHHHLICKCCGEMQEIAFCPYENVSSKQLDELGFEVVDHKFEIYGYCSQCSHNRCNRMHKRK